MTPFKMDNCQRGSDVSGAILKNLLEWIDLERSQFTPLKLGVHGANLRAARDVTDEDYVVARLAAGWASSCGPSVKSMSNPTGDNVGSSSSHSRRSR